MQLDGAQKKRKVTNSEEDYRTIEERSGTNGKGGNFFTERTESDLIEWTLLMLSWPTELLKVPKPELLSSFQHLYGIYLFVYCFIWSSL